MHGVVLTLVLLAIQIPVFIVGFFVIIISPLLNGVEGVIIWYILQVLIFTIVYGLISHRVAIRYSLATERLDLAPCEESMVDITYASPRAARETGMSHIPEDRHRRGVILKFTVEENISLGTHYKKPFARGPGNLILSLKVIKSTTEGLVDDYSIKLSNVDALASTLSGGNQQKVVVARELATNPVLVIASQPTRGLDVGATEYIHEVLIKLRDAGVAVLLVSAELDEIQNLADRIGVIYDGQIVAIKAPGEATPTELGLLMAGHSNNDTIEEAEA